jgi:hypothetical protein
MRHYIVVGNQTLGSERLFAEIRECMDAGPSRFHVIVPATPPREQAFWTEGEANAIAQARLDVAIARLHAEGAIATGHVGDASPVRAVEDELRGHDFDEIIVSTLPPGPSRWIRQDLPSRLARRTGLPVRHVIADIGELPPAPPDREEATP